MMDLMVMCGHVSHGRIITAEGDAAGLTGAQMNPCCVLFDAFHANELFRGLDLLDRAYMFANMSVLAHNLKLQDSRFKALRSFSPALRG